MRRGEVWEFLLIVSLCHCVIDSEDWSIVYTRGSWIPFFGSSVAWSRSYSSVHHRSVNFLFVLVLSLMALGDFRGDAY